MRKREKEWYFDGWANKKFIGPGEPCRTILDDEGMRDLVGPSRVSQGWDASCWDWWEKENNHFGFSLVRPERVSKGQDGCCIIIIKGLCEKNRQRCPFDGFLMTRWTFLLQFAKWGKRLIYYIFIFCGWADEVGFSRLTCILHYMKLHYYFYSNLPSWVKKFEVGYFVVGLIRSVSQGCPASCLPIKVRWRSFGKYFVWWPARI